MVIFQNSYQTLPACLLENQKDVVKVVQSIQQASCSTGVKQGFCLMLLTPAKPRKELREFYCFANFLPLYSYLSFFLLSIKELTQTWAEWEEIWII